MTHERLKRLRRKLVKDRDESLRLVADLETLIRELDQLFPLDDERNQWILEARERGATWKQIITLVNKRSVWRPLRSEAAARKALVRYCLRIGYHIDEITEP